MMEQREKALDGAMSQIEVELTRDAASDEAARARKAEAVPRSGFGAGRGKTRTPSARLEES